MCIHVKYVVHTLNNFIAYKCYDRIAIVPQITEINIVLISIVRAV